MQEILREELEAGKLVGLVPSLAHGPVFLVMGDLNPTATTHMCAMGVYGVTTRRGTTTGPREGREAAAPPQP